MRTPHVLACESWGGHHFEHIGAYLRFAVLMVFDLVETTMKMMYCLVKTSTFGNIEVSR